MSAVSRFPPRDDAPPSYPPGLPFLAGVPAVVAEQRDARTRRVDWRLDADVRRYRTEVSPRMAAIRARPEMQRLLREMRARARAAASTDERPDNLADFARRWSAAGGREMAEVAAAWEISPEHRARGEALFAELVAQSEHAGYTPISREEAADGSRALMRGADAQREVGLWMPFGMLHLYVEDRPLPDSPDA